MRGRRLLGYGALGFAGLSAVATACGVDDLDIEGKDCPCVAGFVCDTSVNKCVRPQALGDSGAGPPDGEARDAPLGAFTIARFGPTWRTSRSVRWDWEVSGDPDAFAEYQIVIGTSEDAVRRQDSTTTTFDRRLAPELATFHGRDPSQGTTSARGWAVTDRLSVTRQTFARLIVRDKDGRENLSAVASETTLGEDASTQTGIVNDQLIDGSVLTPSSLVRVTTDCYGGSAGCFQVSKIDCAGDASCAFEIGIVGLDRKNVSGMTKAQFDNAFVELAVRGGASAHAAAPSPPFADLVLTIGAANCMMPGGGKCRFRYYKGWSFRPGQRDFRLVQVPLKMLQLETPQGPGAALSFEDLSTNALRIEGLTITGQWTAGANVGIDNGFIRW